MNIRKNKNENGFSIAELMIAMVIMLVLMGIASTLFSKALGVRSRESRKTDALTSAEAALNIMSREIANSGFGLYSDPISKAADNGIIIADSDANRIHIRANITNTVDYSNLRFVDRNTNHNADHDDRPCENNSNRTTRSC